MAGNILPPVSVPVSTLPPAQVARIAKAARDFEAMAIGQLLRPMFEMVDLSKSALGGGAAEATWRPMLVDEIARHIARNGGLGLARPVMAQMLRIQEAAQNKEGKE